MISLYPSEPLWCERMQDMSGYVLPDIISPPLGEQLVLPFNTAQHENDFYVQNSGHPSPEEFMWGDQTESVLGDDSNMFDNSNYSALHNEIKAWLPKVSTMEINEFAQSSMIDRNDDFLLRIDSETPLNISETPKVDKKISATVVKPYRYLSVFDSEEPHIEEDKKTPLYCCTENMPTFHLKDEMEVAEEVVVTTEEQDESKFHLGPFLFDTTTLEYPIQPKEEVITTADVVEELSSPLSRSVIETPYYLELNHASEEDILGSCEAPSPEPLASMLGSCEPPSPEPLARVYPRLCLDIEAAMLASSQLLGGGTLPDTPEVLKPVLKPGADFDLVNFLLANGDSNNNAIIPTTPTSPPTRPYMRRLQDRRLARRLPLTIADPQQGKTYGRGKPPKRVEEQPELSPSSPTLLTPSGRPARKSATKFLNNLNGLLDSTVDSRLASSDDEDSYPKAKRRRTISSSSRQRLNSDSDLSSIGEQPGKYRERRDRNNLSSKRSRQKRKMQQELKTVELKDLEEENRKLKRRAAKLESLVNQVKEAWKEYLGKIKKEV